MTRINVAPTRSNLLQIKKERDFAKEGFDILDKKREVLTTELLHVSHDAEMLEKNVWKLMEQAYRALEKARLTMGQERVEWAAMAVNNTVEVNIVSHGVMGVPIPRVESHGEPPDVSYSMGDTMVALDECSNAFRLVLDQIPELTEVVSSVWRLGRELQKTQRRVNALEYIFIPDYEDTIDFIDGTLEEHEREETFRMKWLKKKKEKEQR